jgi:DNA-binding NtrC family response regulator
MDTLRRILLVDDDAPVLFVLHDILSKLGQGYETVTCSNGGDAWMEFEKAPFDLVVTDLRMPGMDGIELTQMIQSLVPGTAVIWLTAYGSADAEREARRLRVCRCLDKPVEADEILCVVRQTLEVSLS